MRPSDIPSPLLDDWIGHRWGSSIRALFPAHDPQPGTEALLAPKDVYARAQPILCGCDSSYLISSFSSLWALLACLLAIGAGFAFASRRTAALCMLGAGVLIAAIDTGLRVLHRLDLPAAYRETMLANLPSQIFANAVFQFALPFALGWVVARIMAPRRSRDPDVRASER
jgi:hypothetical protein